MKKDAEWELTDLHVAFCDIERGDAGVGDTTSEHTTEHALGIVGGVVGHGSEISKNMANALELSPFKLAEMTCLT